eukprot:1971204-Pyramimonas_sp.AAC.1
MDSVCGGDEVAHVIPAREVDRHVVPIVGEGPPWEVGPAAVLHWRWQRPARPEWSADPALVHVVVLRPLCH